MDTLQQETRLARVIPGPAAWRTAAISAALAGPAKARRLRRLRRAFALNALVSGGAGVVWLAAPQRDRTTRSGGGWGLAPEGLLGSTWVAAGLLSLLGLRRPDALGPLLALQALSQGVWLSASFPRLVARRPRRALPLAGLLLAWGAAIAQATPWTALLGHRGRPLPRER